MHSLRNVQIEFADALLNPDIGNFGQYIRANGLTGASRLQVYRNNIFTSLTAALRAVYPIIDSLVGDDFFDFTARKYILDYPSRSGNLHTFGDQFAKFLTTFSAAKELCYLPDVAYLEWAYHQVFHARGQPLVNRSSFSDLPKHRWGEVRFRLNPASRLIASHYPVLRFWQVNQKGYAGDQRVNLEAGGSQVLVIRCSLNIEIQPLAPGEFALLSALADGNDVTRAYEIAFAVDPEFDLGACLQKHIIQRTLVDWVLDPE